MGAARGMGLSLSKGNDRRSVHAGLLLLATLVALTLLTIVPALADTTPQQRAAFERYHSVERWRGTFEEVERETESYHQGPYAHELVSEEKIVGSFVLERSKRSPQNSWTSVQATITGSRDNRKEDKDGKDHSFHIEQATYTRPAAAEDCSLNLLMQSGVAVWEFNTQGKLASPFLLQVKGDNTRAGYRPYSESKPCDNYRHDSLPRKPLATSGPLVLEGSYEDRTPSKKDSAYSKFTYLRRFRVVLRPEITDCELVVEIPGYEQWLPQGSLSGHGEALGNTLQAIATVKARPGHKSVPKVRSMRFELLHTTREPGVCMNWPQLPPNAETPLDMRVAGAHDKDKQVLEITAPPGGKARATIESCDFGGASDLEVTATLSDGRTLLGTLQGSNTSPISLPKREPGRRTATAWLQANHCSDADEADKDAQPLGDENLGDGFSTYEEYRGFVVNGRHLRTRPGTKDLFVRNKIGARALPGLSLFATITGLDVHGDVRAKEMPANRQMNTNRSDSSPRSTQEYQHGLVLTLLHEGFQSYAAFEGDVWRPKYCSEVKVLSVLLAPNKAADLAYNIAHELMHGIGTHHHGENDTDVVWVRKEKEIDGRRQGYFLECPSRERNGKFVYSLAMGSPIKIFDKKGAEISPDSPQGHAFDNAWLIWLGLRGQQHSGVVDCVMRYNCSQAYIPRGQPNARRMVDAEPPGISLCGSRAGTQFNLHSDPLCRYGDADNGTCCKQFGVRDDAHNRP